MIFPPDYHWKTRKDRPAILAKADQLRQELGLPGKARKVRHQRPRRKRQQTKYVTGDLFDRPRDAADGEGDHA